METYTTVYHIFVVLGVIIAVCWVLLPFALIGTKPLLRDILAEQRRTNALLEERLRVAARSDPAVR
jgi:hypothetical protein